jgi:hypothetical protein
MVLMADWSRHLGKRRGMEIIIRVGDAYVLASTEEFSIMQGEMRQETELVSQYQLLGLKGTNPFFCLQETQHSHGLIFCLSFFSIPKEKHSSLS